jgi:acyl-CoA synthetase (AMP-forming)/AMP-acid ligase II
MNTDQPSMLMLLQTHATAHGEKLAHVLPLRDITYRRLWSRIERGSARLHGEWGVKSGDLVAYVGGGHPDAIVLYFSLLRIGASLLPLEARSTDYVSQTLAAMQPVLVIHDRELQVGEFPTHCLDDLLEAWSHHDPALVTDDMARRALWLQDDNGDWQSFSLRELCDALPASPRSSFIDDRIFSADLLVQVVLPSLRDLRLMQFAATDRICKTGS